MKTRMIALAALLSLGMARYGAAQESSQGAVEPTATPQAINEAVGSKPAKRIPPRATQLAQPQQEAPAPLASKQNANPAEPALAPAAPDATPKPMVIEEGETTDSVSVTGIPLIIRGVVRHDVHAVNSRVLLEKTGSVEGEITLEGGSLENRTGKPIHIGEKGRNVSASLAIVQTQNPIRSASVRDNRPSWTAQQFAILLLGLICGAVFSVTAPTATRRVSGIVSQESARCLVVGGLGAVALGMLAVLNANLMHFSVRLLSLAWSPFGFGISVAMLAALAFGWVCGVRHLGNCLAQRFGKEAEGSLFGRLALGLGALFVASLLLGGIIPPIATLTLLAQGMLAMLGLGAALITGFGRENNWLGERLYRGPRFGSR